MSSCFDSEEVYYNDCWITQAWFWVPCIESFITMKVYPCSGVNLLLSDDHYNTFKHKEWSLRSERESFFFWIVPFMVCWLYVWMTSTRVVTCTGVVVNWFAMYPSVFHRGFGSFIPVFCLYSHNSVNFVIGISSMRLNEGSIQIFITIGCKKSLGSSYFGAWADFHWNH